MIWAVRGLIVGALILVGGLALVSAQRAEPVAVAEQTPIPNPTPATTRLPTLVLPPASNPVISRISRETPTPVPRATPGGLPEVHIVDYGYQPGQISVQQGAVVRWVNSGDEGHDVTGTGPGGAWRSGPLAQGESYQRQFPLPGEYPYVCSIHPEMRGFVEVQP